MFTVLVKKLLNPIEISCMAWRRPLRKVLIMNIVLKQTLEKLRFNQKF